MKFTIFSDGGSRGNPGPGAYGFVIKPEANSNPPAGEAGFKFLNNSPAGEPNLNINLSTPLEVKIQNGTVYGSGFLGTVTNNQAEYNGVLAALKFLKSQINQLTDQPVNEIECFLDSQLIVEQMNGKYKIKNEGLKPLYWEIRGLIMDLGGKVTFQHVPREQNKEADLLVNEAIDRGTMQN